MTEGSIPRHIIRFALPLLATSLVQLLYNTVDILFAGNAIGKNAAAAIGTSSLMVTCLVGLFGGISVGCSVTCARTFGGGDRKALRRVIHTAAGLAVIIGLLVMTLGILLAPFYIHVVRAPEELAEDAIAYLRIYFLSVPLAVSYNMGAGLMRALGNSRATLTAQVWGGLANVLMDGFFILKLGLGVRGVAWATLVSQGLATVLIVYKLTRIDSGIRLTFRDIHIDAGLSREFLRIGIPAGIQAMMVTLSNIIIQYHVNGLGTDAIAAMTVYHRVENPIYLLILAFGSAAATFVGQNAGAGKEERVRQGVKVCLGLSMMVTILLSLLFLAGGTFAFGLFNRDPGVIREGLKMIHVTFPFYFLYPILQVLGDTIRGKGDARTPMLIILGNFALLRAVLLSVLMPFFPGIRTVASVFPLTWASASLFMTAAYLRKRRSNEKVRA